MPMPLWLVTLLLRWMSEAEAAKMPAWAFPENTDRLIIMMELLIATPEPAEFSTRTLSSTALNLLVPELGEMAIPTWATFRTVVLETNNAPPPMRSSEMPRAPVLPKLPSITQSSMKTAPPVVTAPPVILIPFSPVAKPLRLRLRRRTVFRASVAAKLSKGMLIALVPALRMEANTSWQSMVIDLVMVTAPKPPGSRQLISPLTAVLEMAPGNVLHGAVRLHGLASSPTPETQVRDAWA